jgi:hypothetical protein
VSRQLILNRIPELDQGEASSATAIWLNPKGIEVNDVHDATAGNDLAVPIDCSNRQDPILKRRDLLSLFFCQFSVFH